MQCIRQAGFRGEKMISSQNNMLMSYILYLMGRTEFRVDEFRLRGIIALVFHVVANRAIHWITRVGDGV